MSENTPTPVNAPVNAEPEPKFDQKSLSNMTYAEIIKNNRDSHKGTIMDKSWRGANNVEVQKLRDDPEISGWKKFKGGAFSYHAITTSWNNKYAVAAAKVEFME